MRCVASAGSATGGAANAGPVTQDVTFTLGGITSAAVAKLLSQNLLQYLN